ncbi:MAG: hypothetical protein LBD10_03800 [Desulfobulbus sp.]|jgi:hypothetical protein|uniref:hypothetical protein n=1 Tax=Desulfobulbus sp. TaxID=895 RepID=UPI002851BC14|nr:hypothetical protein [Desulfobulbus sp.]MDR2549313.1 hypothetical protein [Desulfobulbus sp.]
MISAQELDKGMVMLKTIWYALAGSLVMYVIAVPFLLGEAAANVTADFYGQLRLLLYAAAGMTLAVSWLARRLLLAARKPPAPSKSRQHPVVQRYTTAMIVTLALVEAIALYGLILFLVGRNPTDLLLLSALAAAAMVFYFPKKNDLIDLAEKFHRTD